MVATPVKGIDNLDTMLRSSYSEEIGRPEREVVAAFFGEREFHLLITIAPRVLAGLGLKASEVRCTRVEKHACLPSLDRYFRADDVRRPLNPIPPGSQDHIGRVVGPVRLAIPVPGVVPEDFILKEGNE